MGVYETRRHRRDRLLGVDPEDQGRRPDMIFLSIFGNDIGVFMKQYVTSGIDVRRGRGVHQPSADIAGSAYEGMYLSFDYFNAQTPDNEWSRSSSTVQEGERHDARLLRRQLLRGQFGCGNSSNGC